MSNEPRMADSYKIMQAIHVGDREVVFGVDENNAENLKYMCSYYQSNALFAEYSESMVGDDYLEIMKLFADRLSEQCERARTEREQVSVPLTVVTLEQCIPDNLENSIQDKVVAIRADKLRPEYRSINNQLWLCRGGFGVQAKARGSACYAINLYSGKSSRFERVDVLGEIRVLPDWAKERLSIIQTELEVNSKRRKDKGER